MKLIQKIKETPCFVFDKEPQTNDSCSVVGNSGCLLNQNYGSQIDNNEDVIRFNNAKTKGFEQLVGSKKTFRVLNCHFILNIENDAYFMDKKKKHPTWNEKCYIHSEMKI